MVNPMTNPPGTPGQYPGTGDPDCERLDSCPESAKMASSGANQGAFKPSMPLEPTERLGARASGPVLEGGDKRSEAASSSTADTMGMSVALDGDARQAAAVKLAEEQALVRKAQSGDRLAFEELVRRYDRDVLRLALNLVHRPEDARDTYQESFLRVYRNLPRFRFECSFYTWVYRIAVNKTINFLKQRKNRTQMSLNDLDFNAEHDPDLVALISDKTPRREINLSELQEKLNEAMQKLSEPHRLVVTLHDVQGLSHDEIAEIMECNIGTVRSRLFYARQQLQAYLSDYLK